MTASIEQLATSSQALRDRVVHHPVYSAIKDLPSLRVFMEHHVYAVWDFMSLLKSLQAGLTCVSVPWFPVGDAETRFLINEIVAGEESDVDPYGKRKSHFELYLDAMHQCRANTASIEQFVLSLKANNNMPAAFQAGRSPAAAMEFVNATFDVIGTGKPWVQAAVFTFGREDLIPAMFLSMLQDLFPDNPQELSLFKYYLERHIEVDGGHHSHLALQMTSHLCGDDPGKWKEAEEAVAMALGKRIELWDGALKMIGSNL